MTDNHKQHDDLIDALGALGRRIDAATYAGPDWHPRARTRSVRLVLGAAGALAAAAALVAALLAIWPAPTDTNVPVAGGSDHEPVVDLVPPGSHGASLADVDEIAGNTSLDIPSNLNIPGDALLGDTELDIPSVSSLGDVSLSIPSFSWDPFEGSDSDDT